MTMKNDAKFEEELTGRFITLMGSFWAKYIMFELKKYRRVMFDGELKEIWLVLSKMAWGIWQIFISWKIAISF